VHKKEFTCKMKIYLVQCSFHTPNAVDAIKLRLRHLVDVAISACVPTCALLQGGISDASFMPSRRYLVGVKVLMR